MTANLDLDINAFPTIDISALDYIVGGAEREGWGQWAGKYAGAFVGGAAGVAAGTPGGPLLQGGLGAVGAAAGYDYGGRFGNWLTGGR